jgi:hypothetical protein
MSLRRRLARLERLLPLPPPPSPEELLREERWKQIAARWMNFFEQAAPLLTDPQYAQANQGLQQLKEACDGPFGPWLRDLSRGWCRLPKLTPEAMKDLLLAWLSPEATRGQICRQCGLEYPLPRLPPSSEWKLLPGKRPMEGHPPWYDLPEFFQECPGCGASRFNMDWPHLVEDKHYPWMEWDGYIGIVSRRKPSAR